MTREQREQREQTIEELKAIKSAYADKKFHEERLMQSEEQALDMAIKALEQEPTDYQQGYVDGVNQMVKEMKAEQEPCDDKRLFIKIYADYEPSVVAEKVYQICDEDEFPEVVSRLNAYLEPCEDAVSREAVLQAVSEGCFELRGVYGRCEELINALPSVTKKSGKWIPVSERLPEDNYAVLIWCPERKNIYCAYREENQWWIFGAYFQKVPLEVIAWMPLPKPYEPQESEEQTE